MKMEIEWIMNIADLPHDDCLFSNIEHECHGNAQLDMLNLARNEHPKSKNLEYINFSWNDTSRQCPAPEVFEKCINILTGKWPIVGTSWATWYEKAE